MASYVKAAEEPISLSCTVYVYYVLVLVMVIVMQVHLKILRSTEDAGLF